jgi:cytochrome c-type biogenesis protein CcmE
MWRSKRRIQVLIGSLVIILSLGYLVFGGLRDTMVYFVTPTELRAQGAQALDKPVRLSGMVVPGSLSDAGGHCHGSGAAHPRLSPGLRSA